MEDDYGTAKVFSEYYSYVYIIEMLTSSVYTTPIHNPGTATIKELDVFGLISELFIS